MKESFSEIEHSMNIQSEKAYSDSNLLPEQKEVVDLLF